MPLVRQRISVGWAAAWLCMPINRINKQAAFLNKTGNVILQNEG
jgi:hypothetical protein